LDKNLAKTQKNFKKTLGQLSNDVDNFKVGLQESISDSIDNIAGRKKLELYADVTVDNVKDSEQASGQGSGGRPQVQSASTLQSRGLMSTGIGSQLRADGDIIDQETTKINENLALFNIRAREIMAEATQGFAEGFGNIIGNIATGNVGIQALLGLMLETFGNVAIRLGKLAISIGLAVEGIKKALTNLNPGPALVAGIALIALGTIAKSAAANIAESAGSNGEAFADGGIVSGPVNALVGEYAGARSNPEVIAPLDKLKSMLGDSVGGDMRSIQVEGKIKGQDIILQNARATNYRNRRG
jgi:hypothetical protein